MKQKRPEGSERRRALAEINLIGQRGGKARVKIRGCAQIFGAMWLLTTSAALILWIGPR